MHKLRLSDVHHHALMAHLHPGDGREAIAFILCGHHRANSGSVLVGHEVHIVPYEKCRVRRPDALEWSTDASFAVLEAARKKGLSVVKIHSHPSGYPRFSMSDDHSDREFFPAAYSWMDHDNAHASAILLPTGEIISRVVTPDQAFEPVESVLVIGANLRFWFHERQHVPAPVHATRTAQAFGALTTELLRRLTVGVVGCSGTGSVVVEQLTRLGVGRLVLVDPDQVGLENLNRIVNATSADAVAQRPKVEVLRNRIAQIGLETEVQALHRPVEDLLAVNALAQCDMLFGCVDSSLGRYVTNRLATYYLQPYIDIGVRLNADGRGGVDHIAGAIHYLKPGGSSLLSRGAITHEQIAAESLRTADPRMYAERLREGYIHGVNEARPAVIAVNMYYASLAVLEFLSRIHDVRLMGNEAYAWQRYTYTHDHQEHGPDGDSCRELSASVGLGDQNPMLGMPSLTVAA